MSCRCGEAREKLYLFLDNEIDDASCAEIRAHINGCSDCLTAYDVERVVKALVGRSCSEQAPDVLRTRIIASIRSVHLEVREG
jgi:mycothiol system anti-sigma-R factor